MDTHEGEPDFAAWYDDVTGLPCIALWSGGWWCGYVGLVGKAALLEPERSNDISVHGGVTFRGQLPFELAYAVMLPTIGVAENHVTENVWWGFDCAHFMDKMDLPSYLRKYYPSAPSNSLVENSLMQRECVYRDLEFVKQQCASMALQIFVEANGYEPEKAPSSP